MIDRYLFLLPSLLFAYGLSAMTPVAICNERVNVALPEDACTIDINPRWIDGGSYDPSGAFIISYVTGGDDLGPGTYTVRLHTYNRSGSNSCLSTVIVEDKFDPEITCHDQTFYFFEPNQDHTINVDDLYTVEDNCSATLDLSVSVPYIEAYGRHPFSVNATDIGNNSASCNGTIDVRNPEPQDYCSSNRNAYFEHIARVQLNTSGIPVSETSGNDGGYAWHYPTNNSGRTLYYGFNYTLSYTPGFRFSSSYHEYWSVYIDKNRDGDFTDAGELLHRWNGYGGNSFNFTAPSTGWGWTRIRVVMSYGGYAPPCGGGYGETEDISVFMRRYFFFPWPGRQAVAPDTDLAAGSKMMQALDRPIEDQLPQEKDRRADLTASPSFSAQTQVLGKEINIFPNPVSAGANIQVKGHDEDRPLVLRDLNGREVGQYSGHDNVVPVAANVPTGMYLLSGTDNLGQKWTRRVVVR